jgi:hypothetical protein
MEAALRETLRVRSGSNGRTKQLWSGSGGGLQGRGSLSAAGKGCPESGLGVRAWKVWYCLSGSMQTLLCGV